MILLINFGIINREIQHVHRQELYAALCFLSLEETKIEEAKTLEYFLRNIFKDSCLPIPEDFTSIAFTFAPWEIKKSIS